MGLIINVPLRGQVISIELSLVRPEWLRPHEEIIYSNYIELINILHKSRMFLSPLIVDTPSRTVLDGTHRLAAAKSLNIKLVPAVIVNYRSDSVILESWSRLFRGDINSALNVLLDAGLTTSDHGDCRLIGEEYEIGLKLSGENSIQKYRNLNRAIKRLETIFGKATYIGDAKPRRGEFILVPPRLSKQDVIDAALKRTLFPPKTSRHIFPARIVEAPVPFDLLTLDADPNVAHKELSYYLSGYKINVSDGKTLYNGQYYHDDAIIVLR
jgi:hypothetical protein